MKKLSLFILVVLIALSTAVYAQSKNKTVEVLYFKARQCACKTRVCDAVENQVKTSIEKDFPDKNIVFTRVWLDDKANAALIEKYNAQPQTVVMVKKNRKKEWNTDLSEPVKNFSLKQDAEALENELKIKIAENL